MAIETEEKVNDFAHRTSHRNRIFKHLERVERSWERTEVSSSFPVSLEIQPTDRCNLSCRFCAYRDLRLNGGLPVQVFSGLVQELVTEQKTRSVVFSGGGEPSCHPYLPEAILKLNAGGIETGILTNGVALNTRLEEAYQKCRWIRFSLNAADETSYRRLNLSPMGTYDRVCRNIKNSADQRIDGAPTLGISMIVQDGYDQLTYLKNFIGVAHNLGVDYVMFRPLVKTDNFQTATAQETFDNWTEEIEGTARENGIAVNYKTFLRERHETTWQARDYQRCPVVYDGLIGLVTAGGDVFPCVALYLTGDRKYALGNLNGSSLKEVWTGEKRADAVKNINAVACPYCRHDHMNEELLKYQAGGTEKQICSDPHWKFL